VTTEPAPEHATEYEPPKVGSALAEPADSDRSEKSIDLDPIHYAGIAEPRAVWEAETLCTKCLIAPMCKVAEGTEAALVVVSRCLAFIPEPR
jgi:hypothetical protein